MKKTTRIFILMLASACSLNAYSFQKGGSGTDKNDIFDIGSAKSSCININEIHVHDKTIYTDCKVAEFGTFGAFNNKIYYDALYCLLPHYEGVADRKCDSGPPESNTARAIAIFTCAANAKQVTLMLSDTADPDEGSNSYKKPELITNQFGELLYVPIKVDGTGSFNVSKYLQLNKKTNAWTTLDADSWVQKLALPKGRFINKGVWPDLKTMSAKIYLYKDSDANCCPTGGTLHAKLTIKHGKIAAESVVFNASEVPN